LVRSIITTCIAKYGIAYTLYLSISKQLQFETLYKQ
jgi:hypothetical protein